MLALLFLCSFLDRTNVGNGMEASLDNFWRLLTFIHSSQGTSCYRLRPPQTLIESRYRLRP